VEGSIRIRARSEWHRRRWRVRIGAVATLRYEIEQPTIWRRSRLPTITLQASIRDDVQPNTVVEQLAPRVASFAKGLPGGYAVTVGGTVEESAKSQGPIKSVVPLMLFIMATILMIQLQSFSRLFLVCAVAPLAVVGVVLALLPSGAPLGFVAILGVLALIGILIRNSVILIVQIEQLRGEGRPAWEAVVEATEHRVRPIMLTAAAASLGLIPIAREIFWGPMAYAMMGGIIVGRVAAFGVGHGGRAFRHRSDAARHRRRYRLGRGADRCAAGGRDRRHRPLPSQLRWPVQPLRPELSRGCRPFHGTPHQRRSSRRDGAESPYLSGAQHGDHRSRVDAARHEPDLSFAGRSRPRWHRSGPALFKPLVLLIWLGALIMFVGGGLSLSDRRLRGGRAETNPSERRHAELACPSNAHAQFGIDLALKSERLSLKSLRRALPHATARI
jgi:AcrB/AcrD/AcrF family